ncbi:4-hydroxy-tetrahydrodipicolinate reductase [Flavobacterium suaedae]|uniref:4-hydroxy-tetrahydrodipicolinate reductase n=1 Tax=Flavobacterium suaedae TaxID=1767027 RepID=A0ABQ1JSP0_9FLAO|nr:4-hydroxy-tetrahydrodipicolinate reductase [Flavobacterium suaedae]GGB75861.1 4-hydroxy-tetrahydrodipicolinate reductase [Flavobacterium suaedae]
MKIALVGYGKMGKVIERIAQERGHEIVLRKKSSDNFDGLEQADAAIEFSVPDAAVNNITECLNQNIPVVSGTTGWLEQYHNMAKLCEEKNGAFIYASNFSLGVNVFFELNLQLAKMMSKLKEYNVSMEEIHHTQKLDAPSGTAITLANDIINHSDYSSWSIGNPKENEIFIDAKREENVPGTHIIKYDSDVDSVEIKHTAHSRDGFALGAVVAAEWLANKRGVYSMKDVLNLT